MKTKKTLLNISREECRKVSHITLENANYQFNLADRLYKSKDIGAAIFHLIIGNEEIIKAFILHLESIGFNLRQIRSLQSILNNHNLRYFVSFVFFIFSRLIEEINNHLESNKFSENIFEVFIDYNHRFTKDINFRRKILVKIDQKIEYLIDELNTFEKFDSFRQNGLYVDFNNKIETPQNLTSSDYLLIKSRVEKVHIVIIELINSINLDNTKNRKSLEELLELYKETEIHNIIENFLDTVKATKSAPIGFITERLIKVKDDISKKII